MKKAAIALAVGGALLAVLLIALRAQAPTTVAAVARLFSAEQVDAGWFSPKFAATVPPAQVERLVRGVKATLGPYRATKWNGSTDVVQFERGSVQVEAVLDEQGRIAGLFVSRMQSAAAAQRLAALFRTSPIPADWFGTAFLAQVPIERVRATVATMRARNGAFVSATPLTDGTYDLAFERGGGNALIFLGPGREILGLIVQPKDPAST